MQFDKATIHAVSFRALADHSAHLPRDPWDDGEFYADRWNRIGRTAWSPVPYGKVEDVRVIECKPREGGGVWEDGCYGTVEVEYAATGARALYGVRADGEPIIYAD